MVVSLSPRLRQLCPPPTTLHSAPPHNSPTGSDAHRRPVVTRNAFFSLAAGCCECVDGWVSEVKTLRSGGVPAVNATPHSARVAYARTPQACLARSSQTLTPAPPPVQPIPPPAPNPRSAPLTRRSEIEAHMAPLTWASWRRGTWGCWWGLSTTCAPYVAATLACAAAAAVALAARSCTAAREPYTGSSTAKSMRAHFRPAAIWTTPWARKGQSEVDAAGRRGCAPHCVATRHTTRVGYAPHSLPHRRCARRFPPCERSCRRHRMSPWAPARHRATSHACKTERARGRKSNISKAIGA